MKAKDLDYVRETIEHDGFHYAFVHYSDFEEIADAEFHELREQFVRASERLAAYLGVDA